MIGENIEAPDLSQSITAFRTWHLSTDCSEGIFLRSYSQNERWASQMKARCILNGDHNVPCKECTCGLYGFFNVDDAWKNNCGIIGVCDFYGKAEIHRHGIRSEFARIKSLYCPEWTVQEMVMKKSVSSMFGIHLPSYNITEPLVYAFEMWLDKQNIEIYYDYHQFVATNSAPVPKTWIESFGEETDKDKTGLLKS